MKIINTQDFVEGLWKINEYTEIIKEKYKKEYDLLKEKNIYINDKVAITILIIYFINKEHSELLEELLMIIRKAKIFIMNETKDTYENIAKEILKFLLFFLDFLHFLQWQKTIFLNFHSIFT